MFGLIKTTTVTKGELQICISKLQLVIAFYILLIMSQIWFAVGNVVIGAVWLFLSFAVFILYQKWL